MCAHTYPNMHKPHTYTTHTYTLIPLHMNTCCILLHEYVYTHTYTTHTYTCTQYTNAHTLFVSCHIQSLLHIHSHTYRHIHIHVLCHTHSTHTQTLSHTHTLSCTHHTQFLMHTWTSHKYTLSYTHAHTPQTIHSFSYYFSHSSHTCITHTCITHTLSHTHATYPFF